MVRIELTLKCQHNWISVQLCLEWREHISTPTLIDHYITSALRSGVGTLVDEV
jgi:hypothetical protein